MLKDGGKTTGSVRTVPLRALVVDELEAHRKRLAETALRAGPRGRAWTESEIRYPATGP
jgi:hypothetical protein